MHRQDNGGSLMSVAELTLPHSPQQKINIAFTYKIIHAQHKMF